MNRCSSIIGTVFVLSSFSIAAEEYANCTTEDKNEVCQAYLNGVKINCEEAFKKISAAEEKKAEEESSFMARALEQRAGQRIRSNVGM
jgi:hypothetical protein